MDLYRYFHPHFNPRLNKTPIRLVELSELEQASVELKKALERAERRAGNGGAGIIGSEHFSLVVEAMNFVVDSLDALIKAHPGDDRDAMLSLLRERQNSPGWENWAELVKQRFEALRDCDYQQQQRDKQRAV